MKTINFLNYPIANSTLDEVCSYLEQNNTPFRHITTLNTTILMKTKHASKLQNHLQESDLIVPDGIGILWAIKKQKNKTINRITGADLVTQLLQRETPPPSKEKRKLYLLGSHQKTVEKAKQNIRKNHPSWDIVGAHSGYFKPTEEPQIIQSITQSKADLILVGMGFPKQEEFIMHLKETATQGIAIGIGGVIDMLAGDRKRAPKWVQKSHCEWLYRMIQRPKQFKELALLIRFMLRYILRKPVHD